MAILIINIKELIQVEEKPRLKVSGAGMSTMKTIKDAWLLIENDRIADFGKMPCDENLLKNLQPGNKIQDTTSVIRHPSSVISPPPTVIDATGRMVFPSFCDSHTHLVYAGSREIEYIDKIKGLSYEEIARRGGGILNSARRLHETLEEELINQALERLHEIMMLGTGAVEIKSGYGLTVEDELKMLRVIKKLKALSPITIVPTFLGAHALPASFAGKQDEFVDMVISEMIPQVASCLLYTSPSPRD